METKILFILSVETPAYAYISNMVQKGIIPLILPMDREFTGYEKHNLDSVLEYVNPKVLCIVGFDLTDTVEIYKHITNEHKTISKIICVGEDNVGTPDMSLNSNIFNSCIYTEKGRQTTDIPMTFKELLNIIDNSSEKIKDSVVVSNKNKLSVYERYNVKR